MPHDPFKSEDKLEFTKDDIGDFLLYVLTVGLYNQPDLIMREYIQNSHDAICLWEAQSEPGEVRIRVDWPNIHIYDNGPGMDKEELLGAMKGLGKSFKNISESSGFMGIGKLAGLSMAKRVEIHSSKYGDPEKNWVAFESAEMLAGIVERRSKGEHHSIFETLNYHTKVNLEPLPEDAEKHYTSVHLLGIYDDYKDKVEDSDNFLRSIGLIAPVRQNPQFGYANKVEQMLQLMIPEHYKPIDIFINGNPVFRPFVEGLDSPQEIQVADENGSLVAYGWACLNIGSSERNKRQIVDESLRGIALMQRGIPIGRRNFAEEIGLYPSTGDIIHMRWYSGELYIIDPKVIVSADRTRLRQNKYTIDFIKKASKELGRLSRYADRWANQDNAENTLKSSIVQLSKIEAQIISQPVNKDRTPKIFADLGKIQSDIQKKKRLVAKPELKEEIDKIEKRIPEITSQLAAAIESKTESKQNDMVSISTIVQEQQTEVEDNFILVSDEAEKIIVYDIEKKLDFTLRETLIYRTIIQAIADSCGGKNSNEFMRILDAIEKALDTSFDELYAGVQS